MKFTLYFLPLMCLLCHCSYDQTDSEELDCSNAMVILQPFNCEKNEDYARCSQKDGDYSIALIIFRKCLNQCDTTFELLMNTGDCLFKLDSTEQAEKHFALALELEPNHKKAHFNLAVVNYYSDELTKAQQHIALAIKYNDVEDDVYFGLAAEIEFFLDNLDKANELILKTMELAPTIAYYQRTYGAILEAKGEYQRSLDLSNRVLTSMDLSTNDSIDFLGLKAMSLFLLGDSLEACEVNDKIYELNHSYRFSEVFRFCDE